MNLHCCVHPNASRVRKLVELVLHPHMLAITETGDESNGNLLMGNDWGEKLTPSQVLAMSDDDLDTWMVANAGDGIHTTVCWFLFLAHTVSLSLFLQ